MQVDIYHSPPQKGLQGWRGPGVVTAVDQDGRVSVRWQGSTEDYPLRKVRPHFPLAIGVEPSPSALVEILEAANVEPDDAIT
eukprot:807094-Alexandrium_andersonii.AAC.1